MAAAILVKDGKSESREEEKGEDTTGVLKPAPTPSTATEAAPPAIFFQDQKPGAREFSKSDFSF